MIALLTRYLQILLIPLTVTYYFAGANLHCWDCTKEPTRSTHYFEPGC